MEKDLKNKVKEGIYNQMHGFDDTANEILQKYGISKDVDTFLKDANEEELIWFWCHFVPICEDKDGNYYMGDYDYM